MIEKFNINTTLIKYKFSNHLNIKNKLINLINQQKAEKINTKDLYYNDNISLTDWAESSNFTIEWKKYFIVYFNEVLKQITHTLGYDTFEICNLWFQKYNKNGYHNWHIHGCNYTGVYYLNLPKGSSGTKLLDDYNLKTVFSIEAKEGDMIFFPSHIIHKGDIQLIDQTKIIISYNINFFNIKKEILDYLKNY